MRIENQTESGVPSSSCYAKSHTVSMHGQHLVMQIKLTRLAPTVDCCKFSFGFGLIRDCTTQISFGKKRCAL